MTWTTTQAQEYGRTLLEGDRVRLRPWRDDDLPHLAAWENDPATAALQSTTIRPQSASIMVERFRSGSAYNGDTQIGFCVAARKDDTLAGYVCLWGANLQSRSATFAIILGPAFQGRGYGPEAIRLMLRYGFDEMGLHRIQLGVWAYNDRAIAAYRKCGFREEGRRRDAIFHAGRFHDELMMAVLEPEWRAGPVSR